MRNLLVEICYNGKNYHGYQVQKNAMSVTEALQNAIEEVLYKREEIVGCSRTDSGVHANSYFFHMKTENPIPAEKFAIVLNRKLPLDIGVLSCQEVPLDFHARYDCKAKEYIYKIFNTSVKDPFQAGLSLFYPRKIDIEKLNLAAQALVGTHDFSAFCNIRRAKEGSKIRTIEYVNLVRENDFVIFRIKADGFLYNMVRIIVGTLLYINEGRIAPDAIGGILSGKDRKKAGKTASPEGLYLNKVDY